MAAMGLTSGPAGAEPQSAEDLYHQAVNLSSLAKFERAIAVLDVARNKTRDTRLLGRIYRELAVNLAIMHNTDRAERSFRTALTHDPRITVDPERVPPEMLERFQAIKRGLLGQLAVVASEKGAVVLVDGKRRGTAPLELALPLGRHHVVVVSKRGRRSEHTVAITAARPVRVSARFASHAAPGRGDSRGRTRRRGGRLWTWVAAGGSVAALAVGVGFGAAARADHSRYEDEEQTTTAGQASELEDSVRRKATVANAMFITAGVLAAGSVALFFVEGRPERPSQGRKTAVEIVPLLGPTVGLTLSSRF